MTWCLSSTASEATTAKTMVKATGLLCLRTQALLQPLAVQEEQQALVYSAPATGQRLRQEIMVATTCWLV
jgi:hypothetical protein